VPHPLPLAFLEIPEPISEVLGPVVIGLGSTLIIYALYRIASAHRRERLTLRQAPRHRVVTRPDADDDPQLAKRGAASRRRGGAVEVLIRPKRSEQAIPGSVFDRSAGGLGLTAARQFPRGTRLLVKPTETPLAPWVEMEVRNTTKLEHEWLLGCQFVEPPPYDVLVAFG